MVAIAERTDETGWCWPSVADIARRCGLTPRGARKAIARLVRMGELERHIQRGRSLANRYRITLPGAVSKSELGFRFSAPENRNFETQKPELFDHKIGTGVPPNRKEPSRNLSPPISPPSGGDSSARAMPSASDRDAAEAAAVAKIRRELKGGAE